MSEEFSPPLMSAKEACRLIAELERSLDVNAFRFKGLNVWPLMRRLINGILAKYRRNPKSPSAKKPASRMALFYLPEDGQEQAPEFVFSPKQALSGLPKTPVDLLFFSHAEDNAADIGTAVANPLVDPVIRGIPEGVSWAKFELNPLGPNYTPAQPRFISTSYVAPAPFVDRDLLGGVSSRVKSLPSDELVDEFWRFSDLWLSYGFPGKVAARHIVGTAIVVEEMAACFYEVLRRMRPKAVLAAKVQGEIGFALILASKRHGIPFVEIQHGALGEYDAKYKSWTNPPPGGYELLPDIYWCWDANTAEHFFDHCVRVPERRAVNGGNLWVGAWVLGNMPADSEVMRAFSEKLSGFDQVVLYSHHPMVSEIPEVIISAMRRTGESCLWLVRDHPRRKEGISTLKQQLDRAGIDRALLEDPTALPLPFVLSMCHRHVTCASSVMFEAERFGVPSAFTDDWGLGHFRKEVDQGRFVFAETAEDILDFLQQPSPMPAFCRQQTEEELLRAGEVLRSLAEPGRK